jgi:hypothetical protein
MHSTTRKSEQFSVADRTSDADVPGDVSVRVGEAIFHFDAVFEEAATAPRRLTALRLVAVRDVVTGGEVPHDHLGTADLPPSLLDALDGRSYHYIRDDPDRPVCPTDRRTITTLFQQSDGRWLALLEPGNGVFTAVRGLIHDAAIGRIEFE